MGREINRLSARRVQTLSESGRHADGGGLYLVVDTGGKRWVFLYRFRGRRREMGLGPLNAVPLAAARDMAEAARQSVAAGLDPIDQRKAAVEAKPVPTFGEVAAAYMADYDKVWRNRVHRAQWRQTLEGHGKSLWKKPVDSVDTDAVLSVLRPLWSKHPETARRLRGRIERILDAARVAGHRSGDNPARWAGHLAVMLPRPKKLSRGHHAAMPYAEIPAFVAELRKRPGTAARALELLILTAARSGEVRGMTVGEIKGDIWTIPADRMKADREHRVPLQGRALEILNAAIPEDAEKAALVFTGPRSGKMFSDMVFTALLKRMKRDDVTAHGFRSSFRDWAGDETDHPREVAEAALAHQIGSEVEQAYRRGDALAKRRQLMDDWADFVGSAGGAEAKNASSSE